ncbi:hypothetical protein NMY22_g17077 [Coprinellus aureogranulatus]|nr:hypothetical protein NMY22_g17077 [Coprinellus aureogranulatus]
MFLPSNPTIDPNRIEFSPSTICCGMIETSKGPDLNQRRRPSLKECKLNMYPGPEPFGICALSTTLPPSLPYPEYRSIDSSTKRLEKLPLRNVYRPVPFLGDTGSAFPAMNSTE